MDGTQLKSDENVEEFMRCASQRIAEYIGTRRPDLTIARTMLPLRLLDPLVDASQSRPVDTLAVHAKDKSKQIEETVIFTVSIVGAQVLIYFREESRRRRSYHQSTAEFNREAIGFVGWHVSLLGIHK